MAGKGSAVCIGVFDGVHRGHRRIVLRTVAAARARKIPAVAVTFYPHPSKVLTGAEPPSLYALEHRLVHLKALGLDRIKVVRFTKRFARMSAGDFVKKFLRRDLGAKVVCVGNDFRFGKGAQGGVELLRRAARTHGFKLITVPPVKEGGRVISSTQIRCFIQTGDLAAAARFLGRPVSLYGSVERGEGRGRRLGFPTVNLRLHHETLPPAGVYAGRAFCDGFSYACAVHIGPRPTFEAATVRVEAHLIGIHKSFYGKQMEIFILKYLRAVKKFANENALTHQIEKDISAAKRALTRKDSELYNLTRRGI